ncbi:MAG: SDR family NAD(P)-dependent oxidoreductase [Myxococcaceae bacterium]
MNDTRIALVTGANQGIGLQIVKELAAKGLTVFLGSRNLEKGIAAAKTLTGDVRPVQLDVTDAKSIAAAAKHIAKLDVLINNAAISTSPRAPRGTLQENINRGRASVHPLEEIRDIWETNVFGALAVYQAMVPLLRASKNACIVNVSSGVGSLTRNADPTFGFRVAFGPGYAASKTAMNAMSLAMSIELEKERIPVNAVSPGFTRTNLNNFEGVETLEQGAAEAVRVALLGNAAPTGTFTHATMGTLAW